MTRRPRPELPPIEEPEVDRLLMGLYRQPDETGSPREVTDSEQLAQTWPDTAGTLPAIDSQETSQASDFRQEVVLAIGVLARLRNNATILRHGKLQEPTTYRVLGAQGAAAARRFPRSSRPSLGAATLPAISAGELPLAGSPPRQAITTGEVAETREPAVVAGFRVAGEDCSVEDLQASGVRLSQNQLAVAGAAQTLQATESEPPVADAEFLERVMSGLRRL